MSHPDPQQQSVTDAARGDVASAPADRPLPGFPQHGLSPHSPIEREIERSERASAALAATRALARASFTDSQLAADDAAAIGDDDIDTSGWIRTEYAALDHTVRGAEDDAKAAAPRNLVGGSFNPGIASQQGRAFPGGSVGNAAIKTRTGAQARFLQEARQSPREPARAAGQASYDKPAVVPMLAPAMAPLPARAAMPARGRRPAASGEAFKFVLAAGLGAVVVLIGGGVAWKAGLLTRNSATNAAVITPQVAAQVAAQADAARVLSATPQEIPIAPAAGPAPVRSNEEVDAALAAAARAAAVPVASVHAAGPSRAVHPTTPAVAPAALAPAPVTAVAAPPRAAPKAKESVADSVARAQARADSFLATGNGATTPAPEVKN